MIPTVEVRWFLSAHDAASLDLPEVFRHVRPDSRTDWYAPGEVHGGVKLREGNLEIKLLQSDFGVRDFGRSRGRVEAWRKWVFAGDAVEPVDRGILEAASWLPVEKTRLLSVYMPDSDGRMQPADSWPDSGCQFEWTHLEAAGSRWLTIGFEAFGPEDELEEMLTQTATTALKPLADRLDLGASISYSYPTWLELIRNREAHKEIRS